MYRSIKRNGYNGFQWPPRLKRRGFTKCISLAAEKGLINVTEECIFRVAVSIIFRTGTEGGWLTHQTAHAWINVWRVNKRCCFLTATKMVVFYPGSGFEPSLLGLRKHSPQPTTPQPPR